MKKGRFERILDMGLRLLAIWFASTFLYNGIFKGEWDYLPLILACALYIVSRL